MKKPILAAYCAHGGINFVNDATLDKLDIVYYAFGVIKDTDVVFEYPEDLERIADIKKNHPKLKVILCIGGGGCAMDMTNAVLTEQGFMQVIDDSVNAMREYGFDGIDLDWEFPTTTGHPEELQKHTEMLRIMRERLDSFDRKYYLSVAVPDGSWAFQITELEISHKYLDYVNIMTYDMTDNQHASHHAAPYSSNAENDINGRSTFNSIKVFKDKGIPEEKILIGGAFYSKKWCNVSGGINGLSAIVKQQVEYGPSFTSIANDYVNKNGFTRYWDSDACAPYLYDGETFITYEDETSLSCKCDMVLSENIAGIMIWELMGDRNQIMLPFMREKLNRV